MIKEAILTFSLVGLVDLEAEAQAAQRATPAPTTGSANDALRQQGTAPATRVRASRSGATGSTTVTPAAAARPVESAVPGTNRAPVINNGVNPDGSPRNGALGNSNSIRPNTTISNGTYNNPSGSGQNTNTGDGTNTISTPNSGTLDRGGTTTTTGSNSPR